MSRDVSGLAPDCVSRVDETLAAICREHGVAIPLAVESGSRAWGFPSPDSDYDCRFIFVRPAEQHVSLWRPRDVIEVPLRDELDVNGWDLGKALRLLLNGNAVVIEWLNSPMTYSADHWFRSEMLAFAHRFANRRRIQSHYLHLGLRQRAVYVDGQAEVGLKKLFYMLRPAAALRWLRLHPDAAVPPMHFPTLVAEGGWPEDARAAADELLARKAVTRELGSGPIPPALAALAEAEFGSATAELAQPSPPGKSDVMGEADRLFRAVTRVLGGSSLPADTGTLPSAEAARAADP